MVLSYTNRRYRELGQISHPKLYIVAPTYATEHQTLSEDYTRLCLRCNTGRTSSSLMVPDEFVDSTSCALDGGIAGQTSLEAHLLRLEEPLIGLNGVDRTHD